MDKIILTDLEYKQLKKAVDRTFTTFNTPDEEIRAYVSVREKACNLMDSLKAYDELGTDLMLWFLKKYEKQEGITE